MIKKFRRVADSARRRTPRRDHTLCSCSALTIRRAARSDLQQRDDGLDRHAGILDGEHNSVYEFQIGRGDAAQYASSDCRARLDWDADLAFFKICVAHPRRRLRLARITRALRLTFSSKASERIVFSSTH